MTPSPPTPSIHAFLKTFETFVKDLQDQGIRSVPCTSAPPAASGPAKIPEIPAETVEIQAAPPASPPDVKPTAPAAASIPSKPRPGLVMFQIERLPECLENHSPRDTSVLIVLEERELEPAPRELLQTMLYTIGYPLPHTHEPFISAADCSDRTARILCLGEKANEAFCSLNMGLSLVRGKWQTTPAGRMLATYAPSSLLENNTGKRAAWNDLQKLLQDLGLSIPEWTRKKLSK